MSCLFSARKCAGFSQLLTENAGPFEYTFDRLAGEKICYGLASVRSQKYGESSKVSIAKIFEECYPFDVFAAFSHATIINLLPFLSTRAAREMAAERLSGGLVVRSTVDAQHWAVPRSWRMACIERGVEPLWQDADQVLHE